MVLSRGIYNAKYSWVWIATGETLRSDFKKGGNEKGDNSFKKLHMIIWSLKICCACGNRNVEISVLTTAVHVNN